MHTQQRAQRLLAQTMQKEIARQAHPRLRFVVSDTTARSRAFESLETLLKEERFSNTEIVTGCRPSFEGMQQMQHQAQNTAMKAALPPRPKSTVATVYVTSPISILKGQEDALATVGDAVRHSLEPGSRVALSLLPIKLEDTDGDEQFFLDSALDSIEKSFGASNVIVCKSLEAIDEFISA